MQKQTHTHTHTNIHKNTKKTLTHTTLYKQLNTHIESKTKMFLETSNMSYKQNHSQSQEKNY